MKNSSGFKNLDLISQKVDVIFNKTHDWIGFHLIFAFTVTFLLEVMLRHSFIEAFAFIGKSPLVYLLNLWIVYFTYNIALIFHNKKPAIFIITCSWLFVGLINFFILFGRRTPFSFMDGFELFAILYHNKVYSKLALIVLIILLIVGILLCMKHSNKVTTKTKELGSRIKHHRYDINWIKEKLKGVFLILVTGFILVWVYTTAIKTGELNLNFSNLKIAYADNGFAYCFTNSLFSHGIDKPSNYSKTTMEGLKASALTKEYDTLENATSSKPNIIFIQLESFFDVTTLKDLSFSENPIPVFTQLKENYKNGSLFVPSFGAGTANTEFEVITSMNLDHFGIGEYPYRTILQYQTVESNAYVLGDLGYTTYAIHNNWGSFYKRDEVFKRLGFDYFIPLEHMDNVELSPTGWAKDKILTKHIMESLESSKGQDFIYTISVQPHNEYPTTKSIDARIEVTKATTLTLEETNQMEYYANQLYETDEFIGELTKELASYQEPTVVVFYGDHLPPMEFDAMLTQDKYLTEYLIWDNYKYLQDNTLDVSNDSMNTSNEVDNKQLLAAYQLLPYTLEGLDISYGIMNSYHQMNGYMDDITMFTDITTTYQKNMKLFQYDLIYGENYLEHSKLPRVESKMKVGISK